jgi:hypothetical protein
MVCTERHENKGLFGMINDPEAEGGYTTQHTVSTFQPQVKPLYGPRACPEGVALRGEAVRAHMLITLNTSKPSTEVYSPSGHALLVAGFLPACTYLGDHHR